MILKRGVITHSSGNFAHALSRASHELNIPCFIIMPSNTPDFKKKSVLIIQIILLNVSPI